MGTHDKTMHKGSAMHRTLRALERGDDSAGSIAARIQSDTKHVLGYLQLHELRGNVRSRRVMRGDAVRVRWALKARGRKALAGAR